MNYSGKDLFYFHVHELKSFFGSDYSLLLTMRSGSTPPKKIETVVKGSPIVKSLEDLAEQLVQSLQRQFKERYQIDSESFSYEALNIHENGLLPALAKNQKLIDAVQMGAKRVIKFRNFKNSGPQKTIFEFDCFGEPIIIQELEQLNIAVYDDKGRQKIQTFAIPNLPELSKDKLFRLLERDLRFESAELQAGEKLRLAEALSRAKQGYKRWLRSRRQKVIGIPVLLLFFLGSLVGWYRQSSMKQDFNEWKQAQMTNQPQLYLTKFPMGDYALDAKKLLDRNRWEAAKKEGTDYFLQQYLYEDLSITKYHQDSALFLINDRFPLSDEEMQTLVGKQFSGFYREYDREYTFDFQKYKKYSKIDQIEGRIIQTKTSVFDPQPLITFHISKANRTVTLLDKSYHIPQLKIYKKNDKYFIETQSWKNPYIRLSE